MKRVKVSIIVVVAALVVCVIALAVVALPSFIGDGSAVPFQSISVSFEEDGGIATINSDAFRIAFEGQSFGLTRRGGSYLVDGRYGFRLFSGHESGGGEVGDGISYSYSQ
jgi:hypothetical protein